MCYLSTTLDLNTLYVTTPWSSARRGEHSYHMPIREFDIFFVQNLRAYMCFLDLFLDSKTFDAWLLILDAFICWNFIYFHEVCDAW